jgi:branched-subunit amino acid transport protein
MDGTELLIGTIVLAVGTFAFRLAGPVLRDRVKLSPKAERLMVLGAVVLLAALVAVSALTDGHSFDGVAKPAGVLVGGVLAWRKAPFVMVVVAAAATAALLRLAGVP